MSIRNKSDEKIYEELGKIKYSNISSTGKIFERLKLQGIKIIMKINQQKIFLMI